MGKDLVNLVSSGFVDALVEFVKDWTMPEKMELIYVLGGLYSVTNVKSKTSMPDILRRNGMVLSPGLYNTYPMSHSTAEHFGDHSWEGIRPTTILINNHGAWNNRQLVNALEIGLVNWQSLGSHCTLMYSNYVSGDMMFTSKVNEVIFGSNVRLPDSLSFLFRGQSLPNWVVCSPSNISCPPLRRALNIGKIAQTNPMETEKMGYMADGILNGLGYLVTSPYYRHMDVQGKVDEITKFVIMGGDLPLFSNIPTPFFGLEERSYLAGPKDMKSIYRDLGMLGCIGLPMNLLSEICVGVERSFTAWERFEGSESFSEATIVGYVKSVKNQSKQRRGMLVGSSSFGMKMSTARNIDVARSSYEQRDFEDGPKFTVCLVLKTEEGLLSTKTFEQETNGVYLGTILPGEVKTTSTGKIESAKAKNQDKRSAGLKRKWERTHGIGSKKFSPGNRQLPVSVILNNIASCVVNKTDLGECLSYLETDCDGIWDCFFDPLVDARVGEMAKKILAENFMLVKEAIDGGRKIHHAGPSAAIVSEEVIALAAKNVAPCITVLEESPV